MSPTPEGTARALKAWVTIRRKAADKAKTKGEEPGIAEAKETASEILKTAAAKEATISLENDLQAALRANIEQLEIGLAVIDGGKEKTGASGGRTDILAIDTTGQTVVIELKVGKADRDVIAQILQYMGDVVPPPNLDSQGLVF